MLDECNGSVFYQSQYVYIFMHVFRHFSPTSKYVQYDNQISASIGHYATTWKSYKVGLIKQVNPLDPPSQPTTPPFRTHLKLRFLCKVVGHVYVC